MAANGTPSPQSSAFISHLGSYPVVNDGVDYVKGTPLGQKAINTSQVAYDRLVKPFSPYIAKANEYAGPYVAKADNLADSGLSQVDARFPIVKESTETIKGKVNDTVAYPRKRASDFVAFGTGFAQEQKDYVIKVYFDEYQKMGGETKQKGVVPAAKALVSTNLVLSAQLISWLATYFTQKKEQTKEVVDEKTQS